MQKVLRWPRPRVPRTMASREKEGSRLRQVAERGEELSEFCGTTLHDGIVDEFCPGESEGGVHSDQQTCRN